MENETKKERSRVLSLDGTSTAEVARALREAACNEVVLLNSVNMEPLANLGMEKHFKAPDSEHLQICDMSTTIKTMNPPTPSQLSREQRRRLAARARRFNRK